MDGGHGVEFSRAFTCSTFTAASSPDTLAFKESATHTFGVDFDVTGTLGTTDIYSLAAGTKTTLAMPADGGTASGATLTDLTVTTGNLTAIGCYPKGINGFVRCRRPSP